MKRKLTAYITLLLTLLFILPAGFVRAVEVNLRDALSIAVEKSTRGSLIKENVEVSRQLYNADKIRFYVPDISINGRLPVYNVSERFGYLYGLTEKRLNRTTDLNFDADITLKQSLITGGELSVISNLYNRESDYPQVDRLNGTIYTANQTDQLGQFDFSLTQPLLKPSEPKYNLKNKKDDLEIAEMQSTEDITSLKIEVVEAYFGVLQTSVQYEINAYQAESATLQAEIDSMKFLEEILSEEDYLTSTSSRLDAELNKYDKENERIEQNRELTLLLDYEPGTEITTAVPPIPEHLSEFDRNRYINNWEYSVPVRKAEIEFQKADRQADFRASSHGLTGTLEASYSLARGDITVDSITNTNNTDSWGLSLNVTLPLWDGGKTGAEIKAARLTAKQSKIELERTKKTTKAELVNLVNKLDISNQKLSVLQKQIELADNKLAIAKYRYEDGQISRLEFLESQVYYLEAQDKFLEELKMYYTTKLELEGKYSE